MLSDFRSRFAERSRQLDEELSFLENDAARQLQVEYWEKTAQRTFLQDLKEMGQELSEPEVQALVQYLLDHSYDLRIEGCFVQGYLQACSENVFEKLRQDAAEEAEQAEANEQKKETTTEVAATHGATKIEGNATVISRNDEEPLTDEEKEALKPENLDRKTMKALRLKALKSRNEHMSESASAALNRGERIR
jgi:hypothetical protein